MAVSAKNMLGTPGIGFKTFLKTLTGGRISIAALSVGTALGAYERALQYATERKAFGKEIHTFPYSFHVMYLVLGRQLVQLCGIF